MNTTESLDVISILHEGIVSGLQNLYEIEIDPQKITLNTTRKEFEGDYTVVVFPFTKQARKKPDVIGEELGAYLKANVDVVSNFNVVKGFLNLVIKDDYWISFLNEVYTNPEYGKHPSNGKKVMVEFSSPNTNKPLHLGHIRNILLGWSVYKINEAAGYDVVRVQIVNDRGIAICKSMLAWQKFGNGSTPEISAIKSDHFVGKYYVLFETKFKEEYKSWQESDAGKDIYQNNRKGDVSESVFFKEYKNQYFNQFSTLGKEAKEMLRKWEAGDSDTIDLWKKMNNWVYQGFEATYNRLGVAFDKLYYESNTYLLGKETINNGLENNVFYRKEDGSVWIDLEEAKLDHKLVLRKDGTSVYMTQDIGTAQLRNQDFGVDKMIYVVADEQNYHFQVLFEILKRLEEPYAAGLHHLSYGMVDLPTGKMKSREGTVVDADDLMDVVIKEAYANSVDRGTLEGLSEEEQAEIMRKIGMAALKFFIVKVQPKKRMVFNPKESVDMQGQTGPYVQNAFVRIQSVLRKAKAEAIDFQSSPTAYTQLEKAERDLIGELYKYPELIQMAAEEFDPAIIANFCYDLAKGYHKFWHDHSILRADTEDAKIFRLRLSLAVSNVLKSGMDMLGIEMPDRM